MSTAILYDKPECPFCWRVRMALHHLGLPVELRAFDDPVHERVWRELTPNDTVPVLEIDTLAIFESGVILEYLHDRQGGLWPDTPALRVRARSVVAYADNRIGAAVRDVIFERRGRPSSLWNERRIAAGIDAWCAALPYLSRLLGGGEYMAGRLSAADFTLAARFALAAAYGVPLPERHPNLASWFQRMTRLDAFVDTAPPVVLDWMDRARVA